MAARQHPLCPIGDEIARCCNMSHGVVAHALRQMPTLQRQPASGMRHVQLPATSLELFGRRLAGRVECLVTAGIQNPAHERERGAARWIARTGVASFAKSALKMNHRYWAAQP